MTPHETRLWHLSLLKRALELEMLSETSREAFGEWLEDMTTEAPRRCAYAGPSWKLHSLQPKRLKWLLNALGEDEAEETRLTSGNVPRGREVPLPAVLRDLPMRPPGRK